MAMTSDAHDDALQRLETALVEQTRSGGRYRSSLGTTNEFGAYVRLKGASAEVAARQAWLDDVDGGPVGSQVWVDGGDPKESDAP